MRVLLGAYRLLDLIVGLIFSIGSTSLRKPLDLLAERPSIRSLQKGASLWHSYAHLEAGLARLERLFVHEVHVRVLRDKLSFLSTVVSRIERWH